MCQTFHGVQRLPLRKGSGQRMIVHQFNLLFFVIVTFGVNTCFIINTCAFNFNSIIPQRSKRSNVPYTSLSQTSTVVSSMSSDTSSIINSTTNQNNDKRNASQLLFSRAAEVSQVALSTVTPLVTTGLPLFFNQRNKKQPITSIDQDTSYDNIDHDIWDEFWSIKTSISKDSITNADRIVNALQKLGPTYVKFGQALASRPDIIPKTLANALCTLQDNMQPFDTNVAKNIIKNELMLMGSNNQFEKSDDNLIIYDENDIKSLIDSLSDEPVAAASVGQVYKGYLPNYGFVAVKVQRPDVKELVEKDFSLLRAFATFVESIPSIDLNFAKINGEVEEHMSNGRLVNTELVAAIDEFMSRIFEELDYRNEANNAITFAKLYSKTNGSSVKSLPNGEGVIVPEIIQSLCTKNVLVMEWIEGSKLTNINPTKSNLSMDQEETNNHALELKENLALVEQALYVTLSQLLDTGVMHADPHGGNLLKVSELSLSKNQRPTLAYLDFGLLATIPETVRDGLVCAVASLVFAKDVEAVASLFGELDLLPQEVISNPTERKALTKALTKTMEEVLKYPEGESLHSSSSTSIRFGPTLNLSKRKIKTTIPSLEFDKLLDGLTRLVPRFKFRLPPYFINNARALGTLEGIARSLDPDFNCLKLMYPYALYRLLQNPTGSVVVESTLQSLIRSQETGRVDREKVSKLLRDTAMFTGYSRRKVLMDIIKTKGGKRLIMHSLASEINFIVMHRIKRSIRGIGSIGRRLSYFKL